MSTPREINDAFEAERKRLGRPMTFEEIRALDAKLGIARVPIGVDYPPAPPRQHRYRVNLRSRPGMWTVYEGYVDVWAPDETTAGERALDKLAATSFPERPRSGWIIEGALRQADP